MNPHRGLALHSRLDIYTKILTLKPRTEGFGSTQKTGDRTGRGLDGLALVLGVFFVLGARTMIR